MFLWAALESPVTIRRVLLFQTQVKSSVRLVVHKLCALVSSGPNKKPFSLKEKKPGDGETGQGPEDASFQHSPLSKPVGRAAAVSLLSKRCGWFFLRTVGHDGVWVP